MQRREFITLVGGTVIAWPLSARAQQPGKLPTIGFLGTVTQSEWPVEAFDKRLRELGWIEGRTITIEYRWAEGRDERITEFVAEFVRSKRGRYGRAHICAHNCARLRACARTPQRRLWMRVFRSGMRP